MMKNAAGRAMQGDLASRFLLRYDRCRRSIDEEERVLSLFEHATPAPVTQYKGLDPARCAILHYLAPTRNEVSDRLFFHYRLFERLTAALADGIRRVPEKHLRDYLIWHYLYRFTHEAIAEVMNYSVRQIYRVASQARCALSKTLRLPPQPKKLKFRRYRAVRWGKKPAEERLLAS